MIKLSDIALSQPTLDALAQYQGEIIGTYAQMVKIANRIWPSRKQNKPFEEVLEKLVGMCAGARRCCYCEDSMADEIEHIAPKNLFPEQTFVWENYLYACGPCNGPKSNQWAIFNLASREAQELMHPPSGPEKPIEAGDPLLINPRIEDPMELISLSIYEGARRLEFIPTASDRDSEDYKRAEYTIRILGLNARSKLGEARREAYGNYRARLAEICLQIGHGNSLQMLKSMIDELKSSAHPTVWQEVKRYRRNGWLAQADPVFDAYFDQVPEAINW